MTETGTRDLPTPLWDYETNRAIHDALPDLFIDFLAVMTRFGDGATVVLFAILFFWFGSVKDWQRRGMLMAIAVATLSIAAGLKGVIDVQRPLFAAAEAGEPLVFAPDTYPGLATPSAHAMGSAAIYAGLAALMEVGKKWQRWAVAIFIFTMVSFSRVAIGVHYVGDVLLGMGIGLGLVWLALWLEKQEDRSILPIYGLALLVALVSNPLGSEEFVTMSIGTAIGGLVVWSIIQDADPDPLGASILVFGIILIPALVVFRVIESLITVDILIEIVGFELPIMASFRVVGYAVLFGLALAVPVLAQRLDDWPTVRRLQDALPFTGRTVDTEQIQQEFAD